MTREEAIVILENEAEYLYEDDMPYNREAFKMAVDALMSEPVKHGRWVLNERGVYQCECGFVPTMEEKIYYNYCPNCGKKMSGEENESC